MLASDKCHGRKEGDFSQQYILPRACDLQFLQILDNHSNRRVCNELVGDNDTRVADATSVGIWQLSMAMAISYSSLMVRHDERMPLRMLQIWESGAARACITWGRRNAHERVD
jgi:hypothetical protein